MCKIISIQHVIYFKILMGYLIFFFNIQFFKIWCLFYPYNAFQFEHEILLEMLDLYSDLIKLVVKKVGASQGTVTKTLPTVAEDAGVIPGLRRSPGVGNGSPPQCSRLENPVDREPDRL